MTTHNVHPTKADILLVEDNPGDVRLTEEAFRATDPTIQVHVAVDGVEAMEFLKQDGVYADVPRPDLILLDLNLPRMGGLEVLEQIKADDSLKIIPTIILTTSKADIVESYQRHANCYLTKPIQLHEFESVVKIIDEFWLKTVRLPPVTDDKFPA